MVDDEAADAKPDISSDEDWKDRVKAENAALDEKLAKDREERGATGPETAAGKDDSPTDAAEQTNQKQPPPTFPPAELSFLVGMISTQAMVALGTIPNPATNETEVQLELARHMVDLLGVLEEKTKGNLDSHETAMLESTLHQLRMVYLDRSKADSN